MTPPNFKRLRGCLPASWSRDDYVITGSACLAVQGIRDVKDLDILIRPVLWPEVEQLGAHFPKDEIAFFDEVPRLAHLGADVIFEHADKVDGYNIISLRHCLAIKALVTKSRPKDVQDMLLIAKLIAATEGHYA